MASAWIDIIKTWHTKIVCSKLTALIAAAVCHSLGKNRSHISFRVKCAPYYDDTTVW